MTEQLLSLIVVVAGIGAASICLVTEIRIATRERQRAAREIVTAIHELRNEIIRGNP